MEYTLLIFNNCEELEYYLIPSIHEISELAMKCQGLYINGIDDSESEDQKNIEKLFKWIHDYSEDGKELKSEGQKFRLKLPKRGITKTITQICEAGFLP